MSSIKAHATGKGCRNNASLNGYAVAASARGLWPCRLPPLSRRLALPPTPPAAPTPQPEQEQQFNNGQGRVAERGRAHQGHQRQHPGHPRLAQGESPPAAARCLPIARTYAAEPWLGPGSRQPARQPDACVLHGTQTAPPLALRTNGPPAMQPGIQFQDVTTILLDPAAFKHTIDLLVERYQGQKVDVVAGARWGSARALCRALMLRAGSAMLLCCFSCLLARLPAAAPVHAVWCLPGGRVPGRVIRCCCLNPPPPTGFEARGLIFGAPLAVALGCAFVPLRKPGKLPGERGGRLCKAFWLFLELDLQCVFQCVQPGTPKCLVQARTRLRN